jgi:hypothetical protein
VIADLGAEAHCVLAVTNGSETAIVATGNGTRGAIYALYALAETVLVPVSNTSLCVCVCVCVVVVVVVVVAVCLFALGPVLRFHGGLPMKNK